MTFLLFGFEQHIIAITFFPEWGENRAVRVLARPRFDPQHFMTASNHVLMCLSLAAPNAARVTLSLAVQCAMTQLHLQAFSFNHFPNGLRVTEK